jgi:hypothetical protein
MPAACRLNAASRLSLALARLGRFGLRVLVLAVALVSYGSVPSTPQVQNEVESQFHEEAAGATASVDVRAKLRGSSARRAGGAQAAIRGQVASLAAPGAGFADYRASSGAIGATLPLRC